MGRIIYSYFTSTTGNRQTKRGIKEPSNPSNPVNNALQAEIKGRGREMFARKIKPDYF